jgi:hypothetical protein
MAYAEKKDAYNYVNSYTKGKYDRITILRPKGQREKLKAVAMLKGYRSVNEFINACVDEKLNKYKIEL